MTRNLLDTNAVGDLMNHRYGVDARAKEARQGGPAQTGRPSDRGHRHSHRRHCHDPAELDSLTAVPLSRVRMKD